MVSNPNPYLSPQWLLKKIGTGKRSFQDWSREEAAEGMRRILGGEATAAQAGALLAALRIKGETAEELAGIALAIRARCHTVRPRVERLVDLGGGYDGKMDTLHLAPAAAFIAAACGVSVSFHGLAERVPPKNGVGVGAVLGALGVRTDMTVPEAAGMLEEAGVTYVSQAEYCPPLAGLLGLRRELGLRTCLSTVEKMLNPFEAPVQVVGVHHRPYVRSIAEALAALGSRRAAVVQGEEGSVDLPVRRPCAACLVEGEVVREEMLDPASAGIDGGREVAAAAGGADSHAAGISAILDGHGGSLSTAAVWNAGFLIWMGGAAATPGEGTARAREALESGAAAERLACARAAAQHGQTSQCSPGRTTP